MRFTLTQTKFMLTVLKSGNLGRPSGLDRRALSLKTLTALPETALLIGQFPEGNGASQAGSPFSGQASWREPASLGFGRRLASSCGINPYSREPWKGRCSLELLGKSFMQWFSSYACFPVFRVGMDLHH